MLIAVDFDKTWTEDPKLWQTFMLLGHARGHSFVMVTGRRAWSDDMARSGLPPDLPIVYAGDEFKQRAALHKGFKVDVWIDDMPGMIQPPLMLDSTQEL